MQQFRFQLDPLLRARERAEQAKQLALSRIERERRDLEGRIREQQEIIASGKVEQRSVLTGSLVMHELRMYAHGSLRAMRVAQKLVLELAGVHKRLEAAREELREAGKSRRAVELLRERRLAEWKIRMGRLETAELDEVAANAALRKDDVA